ncbi:MAG: hypothetical protein E6699_34885, partial [Bradyrhizobium sp.]|uniref:hypothetical protein n=1 Tax=Bradyrhizobium sp. TaxID=376 RepID=UPI002901DADD
RALGDSLPRAVCIASLANTVPRPNWTGDGQRGLTILNSAGAGASVSIFVRRTDGGSRYPSIEHSKGDLQ